MAKGIMYVDNIRVEFDDEATIMDVCRKAGVEMPNFCFHSDLSVYGACRMCMVEDLDTGKIDAACTTKPKNGMRIRTNTSRLLKYRRMTLELMLASHCRDCTACEKNRSCRLQEMDDGAAGAALGQLIPGPLPAVDVVDVGDDLGLHEPLDEGGLPGAHRTHDTDVDIPGGPGGDALIDGCICHSIPSLSALPADAVSYVPGRSSMPPGVIRPKGVLSLCGMHSFQRPFPAQFCKTPTLHLLH